MTDSIIKSVDLKAPIDRVWQAVSDPVQFGEWFRVAIETPFVAGQPATGFILHKGMEHVRWTVTVTAIEPPHRFAFTWHPYAVDPDVDYSTEEPTTVEFRLEPHGQGTRLTVTESGFDKVPEARRATALRMNTGGWEAQVENIRAYVDR